MWPSVLSPLRRSTLVCTCTCTLTCQASHQTCTTTQIQNFPLLFPKPGLDMIWTSLLSSDMHPVLSLKGIFTSNRHSMLSDIVLPMPAGISPALSPSSRLIPAASLLLLKPAAWRAHAATARSGSDGSSCLCWMLFSSRVLYLFRMKFIFLFVATDCKRKYPCTASLEAGQHSAVEGQCC